MNSKSTQPPLKIAWINPQHHVLYGGWLALLSSNSDFSMYSNLRPNAPVFGKVSQLDFHYKLQGKENWFALYKKPHLSADTVSIVGDVFTNFLSWQRLPHKVVYSEFFVTTGDSKIKALIAKSILFFFGKTPFVVLSKKTEQFLKSCGKTVCYIPHIYVGPMHKRTTSSFSGKTLKLVYAGVVDEDRKNLKWLLDTLVEMRNPNVSLTIIGKRTANASKPLDLAFYQQKLGKQLTYLGLLPRQELQKQLLVHHCLVLPSRKDTFGMVAMEAMAHGMPVIVSAGCGVSDCVVSGVKGNGFVVTTTGQLKQAILSLTSASTRAKMGSKSYQLVADEYSYANAAVRARAWTKLSTFLTKAFPDSNVHNAHK